LRSIDNACWRVQPCAEQRSPFSRVAATRAKTDLTIVEQRGVVRFVWAERVKPVEIHRRMLAQYRQSTISQRKVYGWVKRFKSGRTRVTDEGRSVRPSTSRSRKGSSPQEYRN